MTEKVVSLSGGLVLGMAFALFLSVSTTQSMNAPLHVNVEYPSVSRLIGLNDLQSYRSSSGTGQASDTTPAISVAPPAQEGDQGRIIRIATITETSDPVITAPPSATAHIPKVMDGVQDDVDRGSTLQQMHLQHSYIASSTSAANATVGQIARQSSNFTSIANNGRGSGFAGNSGGSQPSVIDNKPQTSGSPSIAQNNPGEEEEGEGEDPAVAGFSPRPPDPDTFNDGDRHHMDPYNPGWQHNFDETEDGHGGGHHPDPQGMEGFQQGHRPETD